MSKDRPGIVADVAGVIYDLNGDLADLSQSVLSGFFSMIVIAQFNNDVSTKEIKSKIKLVKSDTPLEVSIREVDNLDIDLIPELPEDDHYPAHEAHLPPRKSPQTHRRQS